MDTNGKKIRIGSWYKMNVGVIVVGKIIKIHDDSVEYTDGNKTITIPYPSSFEPIESKLFRTLSYTYSYQGSEGSCFAHASSLMIFHNMYKISLTDKEKRIYIENNCNLHLDTTRDADYELLRTECGENGSARILFFLYIYKVITSQFGCSAGYIDKSILYYLHTPFQSIFSRDINRILKPIYDSVKKEAFSCSLIDIQDFTTLNYKDYLFDYFEDYYGVIDIIQPSHSVSLVGINKFGIVGKDSSTSSAFIIPFNQFHSKGTFTIKEDTYVGMDLICFLYKNKKYSEPFKELLKKNKITIENYPELKKIEMERKTKRVKQEARLEKIVSEALRKGGKKRTIKYGRN